MAPDGPERCRMARKSEDSTLSAFTVAPRTVAHKGLTDTTVTGVTGEKLRRSRFSHASDAAVQGRLVSAAGRGQPVKVSGTRRRHRRARATVTPEFTAADKAALATKTGTAASVWCACWVRAGHPAWRPAGGVPRQPLAVDRAGRARRDPGVHLCGRRREQDPGHYLRARSRRNGCGRCTSHCRGPGVPPATNPERVLHKAVFAIKHGQEVG